MERAKVECNRPWDSVGYSRAMRIGQVIEVSGTTAMSREGTVLHPNDMGGQTRAVLEEMIAAIEELGGTVNDVVRTRMFVTDVSRWSEAASVHLEYFGEILPTSSMVEVSALLHPDLVIEIEATAIVDSADG